MSDLLVYQSRRVAPESEKRILKLGSSAISGTLGDMQPYKWLLLSRLPLTTRISFASGLSELCEVLVRDHGLVFQDSSLPLN